MRSFAAQLGGVARPERCAHGAVSIANQVPHGWPLPHVGRADGALRLSIRIGVPATAERPVWRGQS